MIRARKTSRWLLVLAFTMRLSSLCWLTVTSIGTGAGMIGTLPKALHYTISFMGHDTSVVLAVGVGGTHFQPRPSVSDYDAEPVKRCRHRMLGSAPITPLAPLTSGPQLSCPCLTCGPLL